MKANPDGTLPRVGATSAALELIGEFDGEPFYISGSQFEAWKETQLVIDVVVGRGASFVP